MIPSDTIAVCGMKRPLAQAFRSTLASMRAHPPGPSTVLAMRIG
jgi:hypothetical protein